MCSRWPGLSAISSSFSPPMSRSSCGCPVRAATAMGWLLSGSTGHLRRVSSTAWAIPGSAASAAPPRSVPSGSRRSTVARSATSGTASATTCERRSSGSSAVASSSLARATMFASMRAARSPARAACVARSARSKRWRAVAAAMANALPASTTSTWTMCWAANRPLSIGPSAIASRTARPQTAAVPRTVARVAATSGPTTSRGMSTALRPMTTSAIASTTTSAVPAATAALASLRSNHLTGLMLDRMRPAGAGRARGPPPARPGAGRWRAGRGGACLGGERRGARRLEGDLEHLPDRHDGVEGHLLAHVGGDVVEVPAVALGQDHVGEPGRVGGEHLLLQPADRQHAALQRYLAGHADRVPDRPAAQQRRQRGRHRHAGARAVLRDRAGRDVDVELAVLERVLGEAELTRVRAHVGQRDPRRLLHHVAELAGERQPAGRALHVVGLDEQHVAAGAGPGRAGGAAGARGGGGRLLEDLLAAERVADGVEVDDDRGRGAGRRDARRGLAQQRAELALELAHARLARVLGDDRAQELVGDLHLVLAQAVALALARPQVAAGDRGLLGGRVAVEADDLHAVEQRAGDRLGLVGRRDEHDLGEVELDVEVVVAERRVLRRVEHLEQGRAGVAAPVGADLVDLVEEDDRVHRAGVAQGAHQAARQRADVRAAVAADLGLVAHAAQRHADELASHGAGDRLADRGLAGAGRPDQGQDRARLAVGRDVALGAQLLDRDVLDDAVLDVVEAGVVGVQDLARVHRVQAILGALAPRHGDEPVQVGPDHVALAAALAHALEATELALCLLAHLVGHAGVLDLLAVLVDDRAVVLAELAADRLHLLAQHVLALLLADAVLDVVADLAAHLQLGQALALEDQSLLQALGDVQRLQDLELLLEGQVGRVARGVREGAGLGDRAQPGRDATVVPAQLEDLLDRRAVLALEVARAAVDRHVVGVLDDLHAQAAAGVGLGRAGDAARDAFEHGAAGAARKPDALGDAGDRAHGGVLAVVAGNEQHALLVADVDGQRDVHRGEHDGVFKGYEEQCGHGQPLHGSTIAKRNGSSDVSLPN